VEADVLPLTVKLTVTVPEPAGRVQVRDVSVCSGPLLLEQASVPTVTENDTALVQKEEPKRVSVGPPWVGFEVEAIAVREGAA